MLESAIIHAVIFPVFAYIPAAFVCSMTGKRGNTLVGILQSAAALGFVYGLFV